MSVRPHLLVRVTHVIRARLAAMRFGQPSGRVLATYRLPNHHRQASWRSRRKLNKR